MRLGLGLGLGLRSVASRLSSPSCLVSVEKWLLRKRAWLDLVLGLG